ncbi:MAG TPA: hypothetical protein VMV87_01805 [Burkholderiales bacterium]|nr:hypothetical protein [Burkholderiales bacterium]
MSKVEETAEKEDMVAQMRANLAKLRGLRPASVPSEAPMRMQLRAWQSARFARTYPELLASERYRLAAEFFLSDLYGPKDFSKRDTELERILPMLSRLLPAAGVHTLALGMELDIISETFDIAMARALLAHSQTPKSDISEAAYAKAYRACDDRPGRETQIKLLIEIGATLDRVTRRPLLKAAISLMKGPAYAAGLGALHDFLDRGFQAFERMNGATEFLDTIRTRETLILQRLFAGHRAPFDLTRG